MKSRIGLATIAAAVTILLAGVIAPPASASTSSNADAAVQAVISQFWDPSVNYFYTNSDHAVHTAHAYGPDSGLYSDFWWEAQMWEMVMDAYQRTGNSTYRTMIDQIYSGFTAFYPSVTSDFNDDMGWWAVASTRAFQITGETVYKTEAQNLFATIWSHEDTTYGGGIWWQNSVHNQKNVATNAPAAITAARLYQITGNTTYLTEAQTLFSWLQTNLQSGGEVYDHIDGTGAGTVTKWDFSYNLGTYIGAASALYEATGTTSYLSAAQSVANWATTYFTNGGTFPNEGVDDAGGFKAILVRYLAELVNTDSQSQYLPLLQENISQVWNHPRSTDSLVGPDWSAPTGSGYIQSLTAAAAASALQVVPANGVTTLQPENGIYEAENAVSSGINAESSNVGFTGRGYLATWNTNGQSVTFNLNVPSAGAHELVLRYAAGAGASSRQILVNGIVIQANQSFPSTGVWTTWNTVTLNGVTLNQGFNSVTISYTSSAGSSNYLNLDQLQVSEQFQAEAGTLHSLSTESTNAGYTGTGYVAGWNTNGQYIDLSPSVSRAGKYTLTLRYAAGAGSASRYIYVNGASIVANQAFASTGAWTTWATVQIPNVTLTAGANTISVIFDSSKGSTNYLNLDEATLRYTF